MEQPHTTCPVQHHKDAGHQLINLRHGPNGWLAECPTGAYRFIVWDNGCTPTKLTRPRWGWRDK